ncbi:hypothetical protein FOA52_003843 [Chlamydomonas sp. UWO 241]|nr:hypothetical protein FOA52_003843 [Chlamydomonas sp. UWO 241]
MLPTRSPSPLPVPSLHWCSCWGLALLLKCKQMQQKYWKSSHNNAENRAAIAAAKAMAGLLQELQGLGIDVTNDVQP